MLNGPMEPESRILYMTERLVCHEEATNSTSWRLPGGCACGGAGFCGSRVGGREFSPIGGRSKRFTPRPLWLSLFPRISLPQISLSRVSFRRVLSTVQLLLPKSIVFNNLLSDIPRWQQLLQLVELRIVRVVLLRLRVRVVELLRSDYDVSDIHSIWRARIRDGCAVHYR